ncbi:hypothetical protein COOONC_09061 [Cooperia oncophora]
MMLYGMVSPDKDRILYDSCYDMLSTLMLWTLTDPSTATQQMSEGSEPKFRWPYYSIIIKKLKKEIADQRVPPELRALLQFLPIPKNTISVFAMEPYGTLSAANAQKTSGVSFSPVMLFCLQLPRVLWAIDFMLVQGASEMSDR